MINAVTFVAINKHRLFDFAEVHFAQPKGDILTGVRQKIGDLDRAPPVDLCKGYRIPEGLRGWLLEKHDVLRDDGQGLTDSEITKAFRASNITNTYPFKNEIMRKTTTVDFAAQMGSGEEDVEFGGISPEYLRTVGRRLQTNLMGIITDGEMQIHMAIRGEFRIDESTVAKGKETIQVWHFGEAIGIVEEGLLSCWWGDGI